MIKKTWGLWLGIFVILLGTLVLGGVWIRSGVIRGAGSGDLLKINYTISLEDGTVYATSVGSDPTWLALGEGKLLPGVEDAIVGMRIGESKTVHLPPDKAYGPYRPELVWTYKISELPKTVPALVGQQLEVTSQDGKSYPAVITGIKDDTVMVDTNSPLAGKNLAIKVELLAAAESLASSGNVIQTALAGGLAALAVLLAFSLSFFYLKSRREVQWSRHHPQRRRSGFVGKSSSLVTQLARLDDDFASGKISEENYRRVRTQKKAKLVRLMQQSK